MKEASCLLVIGLKHQTWKRRKSENGKTPSVEGAAGATGAPNPTKCPPAPRHWKGLHAARGTGRRFTALIRSPSTASGQSTMYVDYTSLINLRVRYEYSEGQGQSRPHSPRSAWLRAGSSVSDPTWKHRRANRGRGRDVSSNTLTQNTQMLSLTRDSYRS